MRTLLAGLVALVLFETHPASAAIRIDDAHYADGMLTVTGQASPDQVVTLDGKYKTKADGGGHFELHAAYKPATCMASLTSGTDSYAAIVTNCLLGDAAAALTAAAKSPQVAPAPPR